MHTHAPLCLCVFVHVRDAYIFIHVCDAYLWHPHAHTSANLRPCVSSSMCVVRTCGAQAHGAQAHAHTSSSACVFVHVCMCSCGDDIFFLINDTRLSPAIDLPPIVLQWQYRGGAELLVEAGDQRRIIQLPRSMQGKVGGAKFIDRNLVVTLR